MGGSDGEEKGIFEASECCRERFTPPAPCIMKFCFNLPEKIAFLIIKTNFFQNLQLIDKYSQTEL